MTTPSDSPAILAASVPPRARPTNYPAEFAKRVAGREKRALSEHFDLRAFGVNLTRLGPGARSALHHRHTLQEEFLYVLEGEPTLVLDQGEVPLRPGMCAGFPAGGASHHLENRTDHPAVYLEVGDRVPQDEATYPEDDLKAGMAPDGTWRFTHKDGSPY